MLRKGLLFLGIAGMLGAAEPSAYRQIVAPDARQADLAGRVREVHEWTYDIDDEGEESLSSERIRTFDRSGYLLSEVEIDHDEKTKIVTALQYDAAGDLTAIEQTDAQGRKAILKARLQPEHRCLLKERAAAGGHSVPVEETTYDAAGREGEGRDYDEHGSLAETWKTKRDAQGREIETAFADAAGQPETLITTAWNARGMVERSATEEIKAGTRDESRYEYPSADLQGNWTIRFTTLTHIEHGQASPDVKSSTRREIDYFP